MTDARPLRATYRLQLGPGLDFAAARRLVPYLRELGISHLYLSPSLQARHGSTHGYDVTDPRRISADLGGDPGFRALAGAGLGIVLDIVPNHMAASDENPFWADPVLRRRFFDLDARTGRHRRFFSIDELAGVRVEEPEVFETTHRLVLDLVAAGLVDGLRVDHPDGLADPAGYLRRLAERGVTHVWVEKILEPGEELPDWPVEGTTGYEFMADAAGLFIDPAAEASLTELYTAFTGQRRSFHEIADEAKREQAHTAFTPEIERLQRLVDEPHMADAVASVPVYRTYREPRDDGDLTGDDRAVIDEAGLPARVHDALVAPADAAQGAFAVRFQQTTGAIMAKGVEDTALYRYSRLVALNEVGSDPALWGRSPDEVHAANQRRQTRFPHGLLATQTHDTKRSGDVRARIGALTSLTDTWRRHIHRWGEMNAAHRSEGAPTGEEEYLLYQTLVGAWPIEPDRVRAYMTKAMREAATHTSWAAPNAAHETAVSIFIDSVYADPTFIADVAALVEKVAPLGEIAALGQTLMKLTSPGVPDIYNGDELWDLALVDPDNRRPVDWRLRADLLAEVVGGAPPRREMAKMHLIHRALDLRARRPAAFSGSYRPLATDDRALAYARADDVIVAMPIRPDGRESLVRLPSLLTGRWRNVLTGSDEALEGETCVDALAGTFPVALLERVAGRAPVGVSPAPTSGTRGR